MLVAQDAPQVEHWVRREGDRWLVSTLQGLEAQLVLASIGCTLPLADVFERVSFAPCE